MLRAALGHGVGLALRSLLAPGVVAGRLVDRNHGPFDEGPVAPFSLGLAAKIALDELFFFTEAVSAPLVAPWDGGRVRREVADALALYEARGFLAHPATYHDTPPPLTAPTSVPARSRGRDYVRLSYASEYAPHDGEPGRERWLSYVPTHTAHAWLLRHPGPPRPWLVCVHAYRMGFPLADFMAFPATWFHHELGLNVAFPILPLHGPRKVGLRTGDGFVSGDFLDSIHLQAQALWDIRRLLGWLRADGTPAIGVYGLSLGGYTATLLAGLEAQLACVVAGIAPVDYLHLARANVPWPLRGLAERLGFIDDALARVLRVISPLALPPLVPRERRFMFAAMADRLVPRRQALDLWRHWEHPRLAWYAGTHVSFGWEAEVRALLLEAFTDSGLLGAGAAGGLARNA